MTLRSVRDRARLAAYLSRDRELHLYELGDLDDFFFPQTRWFGWGQPELEAICLLYEGSFGATLLAFSAHGTDGRMCALLAALEGKLPARFYAHLTPGLVGSLSKRFHTGPRRSALKLALRNPSRVTAIDTAEVVPIRSEDVESVRALYREAYPDNWFDPRMLDTGCYCGVREGDSWLAIAGVHVLSRVYRVAALGNIATAEAARRRGLGTKVTAALCQKLVREGIATIGLNVMSANHAALECYRKLGFEGVAAYEELELWAH